MSNRRLMDATLYAESIVEKESLTLPIDVIGLAEKNGILVESKPETSAGVSGMLVRVGNDFAIGYATHIKNQGFQRFSIAHELGHFFLPGHYEQLFKNGKMIHESQAGFQSRDPIELEADHFAAGLLMPSSLFKAEAGKHSDGMEAILNLAEHCQTSLTATAIRYAELTDAAVAIIVSSKASVEFCFASKALRNVRGYKHLSKGAVIPKNSLTRNFNQVEANILNSVQDDDGTDLLTWFHVDSDVYASEEVIGLGEYGKTLSVITSELDDSDDC